MKKKKKQVTEGLGASWFTKKHQLVFEDKKRGFHNEGVLLLAKEGFFKGQYPNGSFVPKITYVCNLEDVGVIMAHLDQIYPDGWEIAGNRVLKKRVKRAKGSPKGNGKQKRKLKHI